jgi:hypothetical protein
VDFIFGVVHAWELLQRVESIIRKARVKIGYAIIPIRGTFSPIMIFVLKVPGEEI